MSGSPAARLHDPIAHSNAHSKFWAKVAGGIIGGLVVGAIACAVVGAFVVTGGMATPLIVAGGMTLLTTGGLVSAVGGFVGAVAGEKLVDAVVPDVYTVTGEITTASPNVFVNSKSLGAARASSLLPLDEVTCSKDSPVIFIAEGSKTVFVNGVNFARKGDAVECGAIIFDGSPNVFVADPKERLRAVADEIPWQSRVAATVLGFALAGFGIRSLAKAPGTWASKVPCLGSMVLGTGLGVIWGAIGGPVHAALGAKILSGDQDTDFDLPGPLPLRWVRFYNSMDTRHDTGHGPGWGGEYFVQLRELDGLVQYIDAQGRPVEWEFLEPGYSQENIAEGYRLIRAEDGQYVVEGADGLFRLFESSKASSIESPSSLRLARVEDANGNHITLQYRPNGQLAGITDTTRRRLTFTYTSTGTHGGLNQLESARIAQIDLTSVAQGETPGMLVRYEYDSYGRLAAVINAEGAVARRFSYNDAGLMIQHTTASGLSSHYEWSHAYSDHPRVVRQWNNAGHDWLIRYQLPNDSQGDSKDPRLGQTNVTDHLGREYAWRWDMGYNIVEATDALGQKIFQEWNAQRQLLVFTDAMGERTTYSYDPHGNLAQTIDPLGRVTRTTWLGLRALPITQILPDGSSQAWHYDRRFNLLEYIASDGSVTRYFNDKRGLPARITDARGGTVQIEWSERAQVLRYTDCSDQSTRYDWDGRGNPLRTIDALGQITAFRYDSLGRLRTLNLPDHSSQSFDWNTAGLLTSSTDALGHSTRFSHNVYGQLTAITDAEDRQVEISHDAAHRMQALINENGQRFGFGYDSADRLTEETRVGGQRVTLEYNANGWPVATTHWPGVGDEGVDSGVPNTSSGVTNAVPEIPLWGDRSSDAMRGASPAVAQPRRTEMHRDAAGRLIAKHIGQYSYQYEYDAADQLRTATKLQIQPDGELRRLHTTSFLYDVSGNLIEESATDELTGHTYTLSHSHDVLGNRTQTILPQLPGRPADERALNYLHYGSGHLHQINYSLRDTSDANALAVHQLISDMERDALHRETARTQGGIATRYALDALGRRQGAWSRSAAQTTAPINAQDSAWQRVVQTIGAAERNPLDGLVKAYAYDKTGELRQTRHSLQGDTAHQYDATGRILQTQHGALQGTRSTLPQAANESFGYDPAGNIQDPATQQAVRNSTALSQRGYVRDNLVRVFEDKRYFYDGHARLIRKVSGKHTDQRFVWDEENHLVEVITTRRPGTEHASTQTTRFDYDAIGRRIAKHDSFGTTTFIWEGMRLIEERRGNAVISYVYEPGSYVPLARLDADGQATEQGGLGTTDDAQAPNTADTAKTIAASVHPPSASLLKDAKSAANDAEGQYWASLDQESHRHEATTQVPPIADWGTGTDGRAVNTRTGITNQAQLCKVYYFQTDQVGMPQELTNAQGQIVWQASYKTWGSTVAEEWEIKTLNGHPVHQLDEGDSPSQAEQQQNLRFQGQYLDRDTGLHYNTFRYYDPDMGRFICPDPIGLEGGINLGSYSLNPLMWIDPLGLNPCANKAQGDAGRDNLVARLVKSKRFEVLGTEVRINTPGHKTATGRVGNRNADIVIRDRKTGQIYQVEVKTGGATRSSSQISKDNELANGGILGPQRKGPTNGTTWGTGKLGQHGINKGDHTGKIPTIEVKVDPSTGKIL